MTISERTVGWDVVTSTARGSRHVRNGDPNQDAVGGDVVRYEDRDLVVMAVADGHGGARYVRSDVGAQLAVDLACRVVGEVVAAAGFPATRQRLELLATDQLAPTIVERWRTACFDHLSTSPFRDEEHVRAGEPLDAEPLLAYGSTLLVAILGSPASLLLQLGDGDCLVVDRDGAVHTPMPHDGRLFGGETTSLCLPGAVADFRVAATDRDGWALVLLATDGYGVAFASTDWRERVGLDLLREAKEFGVDHLETMLPRWLADSAEVGGDDATAAMAIRSEAPRDRRRPWRRTARRPFEPGGGGR